MRPNSHDFPEQNAAPSIEASKRALLFGLPITFASTVVADAQRMGYEANVVSTVDALTPLLGSTRLELALVNLDVQMGFEALVLCRRGMGDTSKIVGLTDVPCLLRAGEAVRSGASFVLARPTTFSQIIAFGRGNTRVHTTPMSLDRAIWEYINQTLSEMGSISAAARRLNLDRTSFKRMLRKRPPLT